VNGSSPSWQAVAQRLAGERASTEARLAALRRDFEAIVSSSVSAAGGDDEHDPEGSSTAFERQHVAALIDQAEQQLAEIGSAIQRIENGTYGICERCGRPIGPERLAARPTAVRCIACAARRGLSAASGAGRRQAGTPRGSPWGPWLARPFSAPLAAPW
jgi:DnaK suppressor protein